MTVQAKIFSAITLVVMAITCIVAVFFSTSDSLTLPWILGLFVTLVLEAIVGSAVAFRLGAIRPATNVTDGVTTRSTDSTGRTIEVRNPKGLPVSKIPLAGLDYSSLVTESKTCKWLKDHREYDRYLIYLTFGSSAIPAVAYLDETEGVQILFSEEKGARPYKFGNCKAGARKAVEGLQPAVVIP